ncbi:hypothetical protein AAFP35_03825 [Gordonia sp. CPCC 206044]|uniref:hypothetical protein n=1 Tax=Gordonia sp. CPCC 206044 TaxID=3140793 RepID=UPI003AF3432F
MTILHAVMAPADAGVVQDMREVDVYDLPASLSDDVTGVHLAGDVDQEFLVEHREALSEFVSHGGRVMVNGHVQRIFLDGLVRWRKLDFRTPADLALTRVGEHPVWAGIDPDALLYNTGMKGIIDLAERERIGVAGFYGRGCYLHLPAETLVVHTIGATAAPLDYEYPLGRGQVLVHGGNDLLQFATADRGTARMRDQLLTWLSGR